MTQATANTICNCDLYKSLIVANLYGYSHVLYSPYDFKQADIVFPRTNMQLHNNNI